jgi:adenylate cyclase
VVMRFEARGRFAVAPERLWPLVSDTQRLNRVLGLPVILFTAEPLPTGGSRTIGAHPLGSAVLSLLAQVLPLPPVLPSDESVLRRLPSLPIVRWEEHPFEWEAPRRYAVLRDYFWSPLGLFPFRTFRGGAELTPLPGGGTEVRAFAEIQPRNPQGALLTRLVLGPNTVRRVIRQCRRFERYLLGKAASPHPQLRRHSGRAGASPADGWAQAPAPPASEGAGSGAPRGGFAQIQPGASAPGADPQGTGSGDRPRTSFFIGTGWPALVRSGVRPDLIDHLRRHLLEAPDEDVLKMRPFELADRWSTDRRETLAAFLYATTAGLVEMSWDILCPNCRLSKASYGSLGAVQGEAHCDSCNITFDAAFDRQVEVRFTVASSIREIADRRFCSGGPMNLPHVVAQAELAPGESRTISLVLEPGAHRVRSQQSATTAVIEVAGPVEVAGAPAAGTPEPLRIAISPDALRPPLLGARAGPVRLELCCEAPVAATVAIERPEWPDTAATAALVGTLHEFRDLFGAEALAPGLQLAVQRLAFLFTDLTGSTALYEAIGQARAFRLVQDHFELLGREIAAHKGALVKTIGDAVMATFPTGADAFEAALAMQRAVRRVDTGGAADPARLLKVGVHEGPCIAVGANGRLDYFGTTINVAARVQAEARGGEVLVSAEVFDSPVVQQRLRAEGLPAAEAEVRLRGIRAPVRIYRVGAAAAGTGATVPV